MMKIAVASESGKVANHFGHCAEFVFYETEEGKVLRKETLANPGHQAGSVPDFLAGKGVQVVLTGSLGQGAMDLLAQNKIQVVSGVCGEADSCVQTYLAGKLSTKNVICQGHHHAHQQGQGCGRCSK